MPLLPLWTWSGLTAYVQEVFSSRRIAWVFTALAGAATLLIACRALAGRPILVFVTIARPLNLESAAAIAVLLSLLVLAGQSKALAPQHRGKSWPLIALGCALFATLACYWSSLRFPFLSDDYVIVTRALRGELIPGLLTQGDAGVAFRPLTRLLFAAQGAAGSADLAWWHAFSVILHLTNTVLIFVLARRLVSPSAAVFAAAIFGLHATHVEAVAWMNARADLLSTLFLISALIVFLAHWERPHWARHLTALLLVALAILSKESAYAFVPLAWLLVYAREKAGWKCVRALIPFAFLELALFGWRWIVLGGLGGYVNDAGQPIFLNLASLQTLKALFWRAWAVLFFPVNWDVSPALPLGLALLLAAGALAVITRARTERRIVLAPIGFILVALGPVLPLALLGTNLLGGRLYYLPSIGFALLLAAALGGLKSRSLQMAAAASLLLFHFAALRHELQVWESVANTAQRACVTAVPFASQPARQTVVVEGLPDSLDGVFFLGNGFPECVQFAAGRPLPARIVAVRGPASASDHTLRWDPQRRVLVE